MFIRKYDKMIQHTGTSYLKFRNDIRFNPEESCWGGYELLYLVNCNWLCANATITVRGVWHNHSYDYGAENQNMKVHNCY